jgi:ATP-dependent HslUV protease ATP-binding subunit HslU
MSGISENFSQVLSPKFIVEELNKYVIGQEDAKKVIALAVVNRLRRMRVEGEMQERITPKNVMMIGPTGVGKTEIARQISHIINAPFIKTDATKYTEIGYVGKDVDTIIKDLVEYTIKKVRDEKVKIVEVEARELAVAEVLEAFLEEYKIPLEMHSQYDELIRNGDLNDNEVEIEIEQEQNSGAFNSFDIPGVPGAAIGTISIGDILGGKSQKRKKRMKVKEAIEALKKDNVNQLLEDIPIVSEAIERVETNGIIFIDEIDKIAISTNSKGGEVSREGVQRDLLPIIEGTTISTKHGMVRTDHILFIASGAFHTSKPSDFSPEFQGRFPIRVDLKSLNKDDFIRILTEPKFSILKQYQALMLTDNVIVEFTQDGVEELAEIATKLNHDLDNIGARRLHTVTEKTMEEISFNASENQNTTYTIDKNYVRTALEGFLKREQRKLEQGVL